MKISLQTNHHKQNTWLYILGGFCFIMSLVALFT